jgi:lipopolysaccharide export system permease protein
MAFFLMALLSTSVIIWVFQAVNFLDIMIEDGRDYIVYIKYSLLNFPKILSKLFPFVLFFSLFYVTLKYENNNELIIFWNFGVNKIQVINFIFKISFILMLVQIILTSFIVPKSQDLARNFIRNSTVNFFGNFIKPQRFNDTIKGVTIFSERKDELGNLYNLYLKKEIGDNQFQITYAKKGVFKEFDNTPVLVLYNGENINGKNNEITNFSFAKSDFALNNFQTNTTTYKKTQELSTSDLFICIYKIYESKKIDIIISSIENCSYKNINNLFKEIYKRMIIPLYIPLLMLLPLILIISSKESLNYQKLKFVTFFLGIFFIIFSETTIRFISELLINNLSIILVPIIAFIILYLVFSNKFNIKEISK